MLIFSIIILIFLSAFFSASETSFFNIKKYQKVSSQVELLLKKPRELLTFILVGNTLVNIAIGSIAANYTLNVIQYQTSLSKENLLFLEVILVTVVILIFGEIIPKSFAIKYSVYFSNLISYPYMVLLKIFKPLFFIFYKISDLIIKLSPFKKEETFDSEEELKMLTELVEKEGTIKHTESEMIQSVFDFDDKLVKEILTPRVDIVGIDSKSSLDKVMDLITNKKFSKIPVYVDTIDDIKGILYAKDIIPYLLGSRPEINLLSISREPFFVPEQKKLDDLLLDFKSKRTNIAIVVDEWGGTSGLVTLEDVVEEVIGEIHDPFDKAESNIMIGKDNSIIVDASISIYDLEEQTDIIFPESEDRDFDTLGGLILDLVGDIPKRNDSVKYQNRIYTVKNIIGNRINKVHISSILENNEK